MYHAACIWGVESYPSSKEGMKGVLPTGSFVTCSSDDTIRVWNLDPNMGTNTIYRRNIYSNVSSQFSFFLYRVYILLSSLSLSSYTERAYLCACDPFITPAYSSVVSLKYDTRLGMLNLLGCLIHVEPKHYLMYNIFF